MLDPEYLPSRTQSYATGTVNWPRQPCRCWVVGSRIREMTSGINFAVFSWWLVGSLPPRQKISACRCQEANQLPHNVPKHPNKQRPVGISGASCAARIGTDCREPWAAGAPKHLGHTNTRLRPQPRHPSSHCCATVNRAATRDAMSSPLDGSCISPRP